MTDYTKAVNFAAKDDLPSGDTNKIIRGTEINTEFNNIAIAVATKANTASPALTGTVSLNGTNITSTAAELNILDGVTSTAAELNILDGVTSTTAELNILDGVTSTTAELNILDGVTSTTAELNILDGVTATASELNILDGVTSTTAELNILDGITATTAELNYTDGVTSAIQTQLNTKAPLASPTFTGTATAANLTATGTVTFDGISFADGAVSNSLVVSAAGNVGIGTSSPATALDVTGTVTADGLVVDGVDILDAIAQGLIASFTWDSGTTSPAATVEKTVPEFIINNIFNQIKGCTLNADGTVNYYLNATDWSLKADGTASTLTGADGNVMVEIPKFYYRTTFTGTQTTWEISPVEVSGFAVHPAFILDGVEVSKRYYSAYDACVYDDSASAYISGLNLDNNSANVDTGADKLSSVKGVYPMVGLTRNEFRLLAAVNGTGWRQLDFYLWSAVGMLYAVEYQTFFNQDELGNGNTNNSYLASSADQNDSPHTIAGYRDDVGNGSTTSANGQGTATKPGTVSMKYRGIENLFGNCWNWTDAINVNGGATGNVYLATDNNRANYADDTATGHDLVTSSLTTGSSNIQSLLPLGPYFLTSAVGGTSAQYVTDRHYGSASANRVVRVGGDAAIGGDAGVFALSAPSASGGRGRSFGGRLAR